ncbi:gametocyte-specific factor 1-like [Stegastes partitus]|uniref:Gametocyte-specific factor 1-like n=1 Tax=Stegastes partitus TaxID=144197 RepID=A0A9Y4JLJ0_9TELE|nr:PREDICTED: gametocyte-specific factor 1-like [Stegastes partitus]
MDDNDPNKLVQCPYDKNHQIRSKRFPYHVLKCRKNHPKLASELKTCPYNARHMLPKQELAYHMEICENKISQDQDTQDAGNADRNCQWHVPVNTSVNPNMTEDWEEEVDNNAAPFVWGVNTTSNQQLKMTPNNRSCRAPRTLPWNDKP